MKRQPEAEVKRRPEAEAFGRAVRAGRAAFLAGTGATRKTAAASSPLTGFLGGAA